MSINAAIDFILTLNAVTTIGTAKAMMYLLLAQLKLLSPIFPHFLMLMLAMLYMAQLLFTDIEEGITNVSEDVHCHAIAYENDLILQAMEQVIATSSSSMLSMPKFFQLACKFAMVRDSLYFRVHLPKITNEINPTQ